MLVEPSPGVHVHERHAHDLVHTPEDVQGLVIIGLPVIAQKLQVPFLEYEGEGLGEGRVRNACKGVVVNVVQVYGLLDIVSELVNGYVIALVVHAIRTGPGPEVGFVSPALGAPGVT